MTSQAENIIQALQLAVSHHQAGRVSDAEIIYKQVLAVEPDNEHANHFLGIIAAQSGNNELAAQCITKAIDKNPNEASYLINLGNVYLSQHKLDDAARAYNKALSIKPDFPEAQYNLGSVLHKQGRHNEAIESYKKALAIKPDYVKALNRLGAACRKLGRFDEASAYLNRALAIDANNAEVHIILGSVLLEQGRLLEAAASYKKALSINQYIPEAHSNLGKIFYSNGRLHEAEESLRKALAINPDYTGAHNNLGLVLKDKGDLTGAVESFRKMLALQPDNVPAHSNLLFTLNYLPHCSQEEIYKESRQWEDRHVAGTLVREQNNSPDKERRLRIGYVSPDFCAHSVASFIEPVIKAHNRERVEVFCYANVLKPDKVSARIQEASDHWYSILGINDRDVVARIEEDSIDILVDLAGHTGENRLMVFAHKPAPVQVTWLGYPNTTGMSLMDYRLTDAIADPVGEAEMFYSEELIRLEHGFLCYQADEFAPGVTQPPCLEKGYVTFGSFNTLPKINHDVVKLWAKILHAVPGSRLLLKAKQLADAEIKREYAKMFAAEGISAERIEFYGLITNKEDHLRFYNRVDIGLDPFPYNGTTTTCEALWMGVPVVTLLGRRHAGRVGASLLHNIGLNELVAESADAYVEIAREVANDRDSLVEIRRELRTQLQESYLMESRDFTQNLEKAYRSMWHTWCEQTM